ncbi:CD209 antigen-like protein C [Poeciliopsis prolifica]|uniref:CD209 antigen-like protein C n=1 Tax=Poeciliopsis prolifica TaxID=188132 RepID=UPI0024143E61|nr:CD209 antigen-like protein C [Poeciliopsis prolifica]
MTLFTNLQNDATLPRAASYSPSGPVDEPEQPEKRKKPNYYLIVIGILSVFLASLMSVFIREFVNNKHMTTNLEQLQHSVYSHEKIHKLLNSKRLNYIWGLCDQTTLECSRCLPGWTEYASRCFYLSNMEKTWEDARRECLDYKGDLAVVQNEKDQAFLTNMTFQVKSASPNGTFHSAWIGLQDMGREGEFFWVNGKKLEYDARYWIPGEPNNKITVWDTDRIGQDCVSILPNIVVGQKGWMNSWDDITCIGRRHYICETDVLILPLDRSRPVLKQRRGRTQSNQKDGIRNMSILE